MSFISLPPVVIEVFKVLKPVVIPTFMVLPPIILTIGEDLYGKLTESELYPGLWS